MEAKNEGDHTDQAADIHANLGDEPMDEEADSDSNSPNENEDQEKNEEACEDGTHWIERNRIVVSRDASAIPQTRSGGIGNLLPVSLSRSAPAGKLPVT